MTSINTYAIAVVVNGKTYSHKQSTIAYACLERIVHVGHWIFVKREANIALVQDKNTCIRHALAYRKRVNSHYGNQSMVYLQTSCKEVWQCRCHSGLDPPRIGPPQSKSASGYGPPFAGLDPPTKHSFFPIYSNCKLLGDVLDFNTRSRTIIDEEKRTYRFTSVTFI